MPKRLSKPKRPKRPTDINQHAHELVKESTEETETEEELVLRIMREMGRKGGLRGGAKRREWPPERRSEAALKAAKARWARKASKEPVG
jgi:hypothetical protein